MINSNGWFKLYSQILDWEWYTDINTFKLFLHLILKANWKDGKFMGYEVPRGSLATSLESLAVQSGLSVQNVRTSLDKLERTGEITRRVTNKFTLINVVNYRVFQDEKSKGNKQLTNNQQTTNKQLTTIEEYKNIDISIINNTNNKRAYFESEKVNEIFKEYLDTRKKLKVPNTERAITLLVNKLNEHSDKDKIKMIENAIVNGWKSIYPLKENAVNKNLPF